MKIVTCVTNTDQVGYKHALKASCDYHELELVTLNGEAWESYRERYVLYKKYLLEMDSNELVFFTDGYDVIFVGGEIEILNKFSIASPEGKILMSADRFCAPDTDMAKYFAKTKNGYDFLCAGGLMGKVKDIIKVIDILFEFATNDDSEENKKYYWDDQYLWTKLILSNKIDVVLDHNCEIFQTLTSLKSIQNLYEFVNSEPELSEDEDLYARKSLTNTIEDILDEVEITSDYRLYNKSTKTYPVQIHFNTKINKLVMFMEPLVKLIDKYNNR